MTALEIKNDLLKLMGETDDTNVLGQVRDFFEKVQKNTTPEPPSKSIEEINRLIEIADKEKGYDYEHFKKYYNL